MDSSGIDSGPPLRRTEVLSDICLNDVPVIFVFICTIFFFTKFELKRDGPRMAQTFQVNLNLVVSIPLCVYTIY